MLSVVKIGGGIVRGLGGEALARLCTTVAQLARAHPILVVPGGGAFADAVRDLDGRVGLDAMTAHRLALVAMDRFGAALAELIDGTVLCDDVAGAAELASGGRTAMLKAGSAVGDDDLPASWDVTSDSVAVWAAGVTGARHAVLVKTVDGLYDRGSGLPLEHLSARELDRRGRAGECQEVDRYMPSALRDSGVETWVIGGATPSRLAELVQNGHTRGTRLTR